MTIKSITQAEMLADLSASFPALKKRPLAEFGARYAGQDGFWINGEDPPLMPESDEPMFCWQGSGDVDDTTYDGYAHSGFIAWLDARGWGWDCYDLGTIFVVPDSYFGPAV